MIIDSHHHLWQYHQEKHHWMDDTMSKIQNDFTGDDLTIIASSNNISGTVLVQVDQTEEDTRWLLEQANRYPIIQGVVGWVDLRAENILERLDFYNSFEKLKGFRHIAQSEPNDFFMDKAFQKGISYLHSYNYTYDILIYHFQLEAAIQLVKSAPDQLFVIDHLAKPNIREGLYTPWSEYISSIAEYPNVFCKLSGIITEANHHNWNYDQLLPYLECVFDCFGVERLMFGSDWPVCLLAGSYEQVLEIITRYISALSDYEQSLILYKNAKAFYKL
jgi:L-fuconolactonase